MSPIEAQKEGEPDTKGWNGFRHAAWSAHTDHAGLRSAWAVNSARSSLRLLVPVPGVSQPRGLGHQLTHSLIYVTCRTRF